MLSRFQNISKKWLTKIKVFGSKFVSNTSTYVDPFLLILLRQESIL